MTASYKTLIRSHELLEKNGFKNCPDIKPYIKHLPSSGILHNGLYYSGFYYEVTEEAFYKDPILALKNVGINFIWKDDEITQLISKDEAKELFGDAVRFPNNDITRCQHKWATYTGLNHVDVFCEKCKEVQK